MTDYPKYPGLLVERLPSGSDRVRVRMEGNPTIKTTIPDGLCDDCFRIMYERARFGREKKTTMSPLRRLLSTDECRSTVARMLSNAKSRARRKSLDFHISASDIVDAIVRQDGKCALSGVEFDLTTEAEPGRKRPFCMSLDRIQNDLGYTPDNIRVTTIIVNLSLLTWDEGDFISMCKQVANNTKSPTAVFALPEWAGQNGPSD